MWLRSTWEIHWGNISLGSRLWQNIVCSEKATTNRKYSSQYRLDKIFISVCYVYSIILPLVAQAKYRLFTPLRRFHHYAHSKTCRHTLLPTRLSHCMREQSRSLILQMKQTWSKASEIWDFQLQKQKDSPIKDIVRSITKMEFFGPYGWHFLQCP